MSGRRRRAAWVAALGLVALLASACQGIPGILTPDGPPYTSVGSNNTLRVTHAGGSVNEHNEREVYWQQGDPGVSNATICETWKSGEGIAQNGVAFRIGPNGTSAVVLERNILFAGYWSFVALKFWAGRFTVLGSVDLSSYLGMWMSHDIWPLRVCAHLSRADVLTFAVAKRSDPMPTTLGVGPQGGTYDLSGDGLPARGATGSYLAHLPVGTSSTVNNITVDGQPSDPTGN